MIELKYTPWKPTLADSSDPSPVKGLTMTLGDHVTWDEATTEFHNFLRGAGYVVPYDFEEEGPTDRKRDADLKIGAWLSAALEDPSTCQSMKNDINEWFECTHQEEIDRLRAKKKQIYEDLKDAMDREWGG